MCPDSGIFDGRFSRRAARNEKRAFDARATADSILLRFPIVRALRFEDKPDYVQCLENIVYFLIINKNILKTLIGRTRRKYEFFQGWFVQKRIEIQKGSS